jgi:hypothetical protein
MRGQTLTRLSETKKGKGKNVPQCWRNAIVLGYTRDRAYLREIVNVWDA